LAHLIDRTGPCADRENHPVVVGLLGTRPGELTFAIKIGEDGEPVLLAVQSAYELIVNARMTMTEQSRIEKLSRP
jgi:hypothetical protein